MVKRTERLTVAEAADYLGVAERTIQSYVTQGFLAGAMVAYVGRRKRRMFLKSELRAFQSQHLTQERS